MKRVAFWILTCLLCLGIVSFAGAEEADYRTIVEMYQQAVSAQEIGDYDRAVDELRSLVEYYENAAGPGIGWYLDARLYYAYAKGRSELAGEDPNYPMAAELLRDCGENFCMAADYYRYAAGMAAMQNGRYADAITGLRDVSIPEFTARRMDAIDYCREQYKKETGIAGKNACAAGEHERAQEIYRQYLELVGDDAEVRRLLDECVRMHGNIATAVDLPIPEIIGDVVSDACSVRITLNEDGRTRTVTWASDLIQGRDAQTQTVTGNIIVIEGLLPGTDYRVTVDPDTETAAEIMVRTADAEKYPADRLSFVRADVAGIVRNETLLQNAAPVDIIYKYPAEYHLESVDNSFAAGDLADYALCCLVSYKNRTGEEFEAEVSCILRTPSSGVYRSEEAEQIFLSRSETDSFFFWIWLDELLSMAGDAHGSQVKGAYICEIYIDGSLFCSGTFTVK